MSKIALTPNASGTGTFTIASPNSNTDRTLTLPDAAGELLTTAGGTLTGALTGTDLTLSGGVYLGGTGSANLLDDYEEGTFTPTASSSSGTITSYTVNGAAYTKVGRMVFVNVDITITNAGTGSASFDVTLPFTNGSFLCNGTGRENALTGYQLQTRVNPSSSTMNIQNYANATVIATNAQIKAMIVYFV